MEIRNLQIFNKNNKDNNTQPKRFGVHCPNLVPLKQDTISFKGSSTVLKKSDFKGADLAVIEKYKPNIQQFKSKDDLQSFAEKKIKELMLNPENIKQTETLKQVQSVNLKDFGGRRQETKIQRKAMLKEWFDYVTKENEAYTNTQKLIILAAMTKGLKPDNDSIPPALNKGVLADTVEEFEKRLKENPQDNLDFNKMYQNKLRANFMEDSASGETMTGWVIIPSKENDPENFEKNVDKLKTLSHKSWCTKSFNAEPYLAKGDFHVYLENGEPKLGVRFVGENVQEVQGEKNDSKIPVKYLDTFKEHQKKYDIKLNASTNNAVFESNKIKEKIDKIKADLGTAIELKNIDDVIKVLNYFEIKTEKTDKGLVINDYRQPSTQFSFDDMGIKENKFFKYITEINGPANFYNSNLTNLGNLETIQYDTIFGNSKITNLGNLKAIHGTVKFQGSEITSLGKLKTIEGAAYFNDSKVTDLGDLEYIGSYAKFSNSKIQTLAKLKEIKGTADFNNSAVIDMGALEKIGQDANFSYSQITNLGKLKSIGAHANFNYSQVTDLGDLEYIGGSVTFQNSPITSLNKLKKIEMNASFDKTKITNLGELESIGGTADFRDSLVENLGKLKTISGDAKFGRSNITSLGNLESIGGNANFMDSQVEDLGALKSIGGDAYFAYSKIKTLKNLEKIGKDAKFTDSSVTDIGKLKEVGGNVQVSAHLSSDDFKQIENVKFGF